MPVDFYSSWCVYFCFPRVMDCEEGTRCSLCALLFLQHIFKVESKDLRLSMATRHTPRRRFQDKSQYSDVGSHFHIIPALWEGNRTSPAAPVTSWCSIGPPETENDPNFSFSPSFRPVVEV